MLEQSLRQRAVPYEMVLTSGPKHATELARSAPGPVVVAVGGDGTINEVANGLIGSGKRLGIIPTGSGNDFIKSVRIPSAPSLALDLLVSGKRVEVDVGIVECHENHPLVEGEAFSSQRYFINGVGVGFDAAVAAKTGEISFLTGVPLYLLAVLKTLGPYRSPNFDITIDDFRQRARKLLIAVGNGRCAGGGFYLTPDAKVDDGELDVCLVEDISILNILRVMPRVMRGNHHNMKHVNFLRGKQIMLSAQERFYVHADGEIVGRNVQYVHIKILKRALTLVAG